MAGKVQDKNSMRDTENRREMGLEICDELTESICTAH